MPTRLRSNIASGVGLLFSLHACCLIPGILSLVGMTSMSHARVVTGRLMPVVLLVALLFLGRTYYLLYVKHEGSRFSFVTT